MSTKSIIDKLCKESNKFEQYEAHFVVGNYKELITVIYEGFWVSLCEMESGHTKTIQNKYIEKI